MPLSTAMRRDLILAAVYFILSTLITWWFIVAGADFYTDLKTMILSCSIAGAKWGLQILAALLLLREKRWAFIRRIGFVCLVGSLLLWPFCFEPLRRLLGRDGFLGSLIVSVLVMILLYFRSVRSSGLPIAWFWSWIACLAIAVTLQLTVVFDVV